MELTEVSAQQFLRFRLLPALNLLKSYAFMFGCRDTKLFMESANMGSFTLPKRSARRMVMRARPWITAMTLLY